ncbi:MAG: glycoside hydrolase family 15 protein, partial [Gemmatimonadetes bacterium]|nr:glycoside hydrolase family 15 protein [Gemmatimonadota bacterium]
MNSLDLALIGNGTLSALIDRHGAVVWGCFPRFDGDPAFCTLLGEATEQRGHGVYVVELLGCVREEQEYLVNTPVLITRLYDASGS